MTARKLFIILITVAAVLVMYILYGIFYSTPVTVMKGKTSEENAPYESGKMGKVGLTRVGTVVKAVYTDLDENKNVKREFGFEKLLHESGNEWTIEKPYMNIIEKDFICGITADSGKVQVEMAAGKPAPKDAQLSGNVVIHILPEKGARMSESFIYMDDISFISEKSLFTTDGPVRFVSADAEMSGRGLEVIYNTGKDRLELMHLMKLESLRLKTFKESMFAKRGGTSQDNQTGVAAAATSDAQSAPRTDDKQNEEQYYRCTLNKNVVINYGSQAVLADEVTISNLYWPKNKKKKDAADLPSSDGNKTDVNSTSGSDSQIVPITITCDNGIMLRPMEATTATDFQTESPQRLLEFTGTPVTIKTSDKVDADSNAEHISGGRILAECGWLKYNLDLGVLDMFSGDPPQNVLLSLEQDGSKLETTDSLRWSLKDRTAIIRGPGILYLAAKQAGGQTPDADNARMNFGGTMNVAFANELFKKPLQKSMSIKSISLAGGFTAAMQHDKAHLAADSATVNFAGGNVISEANLDGNVKFSSDTGSLKSEKAKVFFAKDNVISQADFDGNVNFNSTTGSARSEKAKILFDKGNTISEAALNGNVNFASGTGTLKSENAKVFFAKDSKGGMYASTVESSGNVEIVPAAAKDRSPQGVFRAQRIDYDVPKGHAVAKGPVELVFNDANGVPATITAKRKAEYFLKSNEVIFDGDVQGKMTRGQGGPTEYSEFRGDKLTAKLGRAQQGKADLDAAQRSGIEHLAITGDVVTFESYQKQQDKILGSIKLKCRQADYDGIKNMVQTSGGKDCFAYIDNSKAPETAKSGNWFNPKGPCLIYLQDFENLQWYMSDNRIVANGVPGGMHITYLPTAEGKDGQKVQIDASHVQIDLTQKAAGRKEIAAVKATGGIYYHEDINELYGKELLYDGIKSLINITGDASTACMANGVRCKSITINSSNGTAQMEGFTGGWILVPPKKAK
jgi:lipopolysaccharide export system protein LptA